MTLSGPAVLLDAGDDPTPNEMVLLDLFAPDNGSANTAPAVLTFPRRAAAARHARLVAHLDTLEAQAADRPADPAVHLLIAALRSVTARHFPWSVYNECDCEPGHRDQDEPGVVDVDEVGLVCEEGFLYSICAECCTDENSWEKNQQEHCANDHDHVSDRPLCQTLTGIEGALGLGEPDWATTELGKGPVRP